MGKQFHSHGIITGQPQVSAMGCMLSYGKDTDSTAFKVLTKMTKLDDCCAQCAQDERCLVWSFNSQESRCYLKNSHGSVIRNANVTLGVPEMSTSGCIVTVDSDSDAPVYRKLITVGTADQCCTQCGADAACNSWSFDSQRHTCFLKSGKGNKVDRKGFLLGFPGFRNPIKPRRRVPMSGPDAGPRDVRVARGAGYQQPKLPQSPVQPQWKWNWPRNFGKTGSISYANYRHDAGDDTNLITVGNGARVRVSNGGQLYVGPQANVDVGGQATVNVAGQSEMHVTGAAQVAADGNSRVFLHHDNVDMHDQARLNIQGRAPVSVDGPGARVSVAGVANVEARGGSNVHVHHDSHYITTGYMGGGSYSGPAASNEMQVGQPEGYEEGYGAEEGAPEGRLYH